MIINVLLPTHLLLLPCLLLSFLEVLMLAENLNDESTHRFLILRFNPSIVGAAICALSRTFPMIGFCATPEHHFFVS